MTKVATLLPTLSMMMKCGYAIQNTLCTFHWSFTVDINTESSALKISIFWIYTVIWVQQSNGTDLPFYVHMQRCVKGMHNFGIKYRLSHTIWNRWQPCISPGKWTTGPFVAAVQRHSLNPVNMNNKKYVALFFITRPNSLHWVNMAYRTKAANE
jgi:hypothetical protein